jgi:hypothetical protein
MKRPVWVLLGVAVAVLLVWTILRPSGDGEVAVDLIDMFDSAVDKRPSPDVFQVVDATIAGETRRAILVKEPSRLVYRVTVPTNGELRIGLGLLEEGWTTPGDGVLFRVLIGAGGPPEEILNILLNPYGNPNDRRWQDLSLDLSEYSGETVDLFFNTNSSPPVKPPQDNRDGDLAVWGTPRLFAR